MANKSQDARRAAKKPAGKTYGGSSKEKTAYQRERDAFKNQSKHKRGLANSYPRGC